MSLSPEDVEDILKVLDSTAYDELELATDRFVLRLRRQPGGWTEELTGRRRAQLLEPTEDLGSTAPAAAPGGATPEGAAPAGEAGLAGDDRPGLVAVRAPLPGVFYRSPKPGEPPFVEVGQRVEPDTVVAILETMKLMNPVRAGSSGIVAELALANNEPAEQGVVLLWLTPDDEGAPER